MQQSGSHWVHRPHDSLCGIGSLAGRCHHPRLGRLALTLQCPVVDDEVSDNVERRKRFDAESQSTVSRRSHRIQPDVARQDQPSVNRDRGGRVIAGSVPEGQATIMSRLEHSQRLQDGHVPRECAYPGILARGRSHRIVSEDVDFDLNGLSGDVRDYESVLASCDCCCCATGVILDCLNLVLVEHPIAIDRSHGSQCVQRPSGGCGVIVHVAVHALDQSGRAQLLEASVPVLAGLTKELVTSIAEG